MARSSGASGSGRRGPSSPRSLAYREGPSSPNRPGQPGPEECEGRARRATSGAPVVPADRPKRSQVLARTPLRAFAQRPHDDAARRRRRTVRSEGSAPFRHDGANTSWRVPARGRQLCRWPSVVLMAWAYFLRDRLRADAAQLWPTSPRAGAPGRPSQKLASSLSARTPAKARPGSRSGPRGPYAFCRASSRRASSINLG